MLSSPLSRVCVLSQEPAGQRAPSFETHPARVAIQVRCAVLSGLLLRHTLRRFHDGAGLLATQRSHSATHGSQSAHAARYIVSARYLIPCSVSSGSHATWAWCSLRVAHHAATLAIRTGAKERGRRGAQPPWARARRRAACNRAKRPLDRSRRPERRHGPAPRPRRTRR